MTSIIYGRYSCLITSNYNDSISYLITDRVSAGAVN